MAATIVPLGPGTPGTSYGRTVRGIIEGDAIPSEFIPVLIELHRQGQFPFDRGTGSPGQQEA